jgi:type II secretory ATPase GspE/PulE/Tfp pilus assembly ATPase PilB-like protein
MGRTPSVFLGRNLCFMVLPGTDLLFGPVRLACLLFWFYLCMHLTQRLQPSGLMPKKHKQVSSILLLLTGPLYVFVLLVVDVVRKKDDQGISLVESIGLTFGKLLGRKIRSSTRGQNKFPVTLVDSSGRNLSDIYNRAKLDHNGASALEVTEEIIGDAIQQLSSDILINPTNTLACSVRFRIDGMLRNICELDTQVSTHVINSIKVISGMDIAEKRRPQDGAFMAKTPKGDISFRVASAGILHGEKLSIRLLNQLGAPLTLEDIGMSQDDHKIITSTISRQNGMILVCGPTGSGKSTTLYAMLRQIDFDVRNVITIEDPIEYAIPQASQIEINPKAGITFAKTLRSVLRQDPDVISIGEIRDEETATIALQASQTGHLVLATLHSSSNKGSLVRLMDLGIKPLLLASALDVIMSQRLVRKLCDDCKRPDNLSDTQIARLTAKRIDSHTVMRAAGCRNCGWTGYRGRTGVFDITVLDGKIKAQLIDEKLSMGEFQKEGDEQGRTRMQKQAIQMVLTGKTSLDEAKRVILNLG